MYSRRNDRKLLLMKEIISSLKKIKGDYFSSCTILHHRMFYFMTVLCENAQAFLAKTVLQPTNCDEFNPLIFC